LITEGAIEKVLQFTMPQKSLYNKKYVLMKNNVGFYQSRKVKRIKKVFGMTFFIFRRMFCLSVYLFRAVIYEHILFYKDVLCNYESGYT
jgi:hypothetical protein